MWLRKIWLFLSCFLFTACIGHSPIVNQPDTPTIQELAINTTVAFVDSPINYATDMLPFCAGVWINRNTMLTALHCAQGQATSDKIKEEIEKLPKELKPLAPSLLKVKTVEDPTGVTMRYSVSYEMRGIDQSPTNFHKAVVVLIDRLHDLALIKANGSMPHHGWLPISNYPPRQGDKIIIIGHPGGLTYTFMDGIVSALRNDFPRDPDDEDDIIEGPFIQVYSGIWHGNSGGALVSQKGEIIGIVSFLSRSPGQSFSIAPSSINHFIDKANELHMLK